MSLNLSCLNIYENLSLIENKNSVFDYPIYKPTGESLLRKFSSSITNSIFSLNDLKFFLKNSSINSLKFPSKLVSSIIIYSSLIILLLITCSIIFYIISYSNLKKFQLKEIRLKKCYFILFILINFFLFIQMIFLIQNLNQTKEILKKSIEEFNSLNLSKHLKYLLNKFDQLSINSLIIDQTKFLMRKRFSNLLNNYYFINQMNLFLNNINKYFNQLRKKRVIKNSFIQFQISYENILKDLFDLNEKICSNFEENSFQIEQKILFLLNLISQQFHNFIYLIDQEILKKSNWNFFDQNKEEQIRSRILFLINLTIINIIFITIIPITFFTFIIINYFYFYFNHQNNIIKDQILQYHNNTRLHHLDVKQLQSSDHQQRYTTHTYRDVDNLPRKKCRSRKVHSSHRNSNSKRCYIFPIRDLIVNKSSKCSYHLFLNPIRIAFGLITLLLIMLCILSAFFYGIDLFLQSSCRLVHYDQPFLISFATDNLIKSIDGFDVNKTLNNVINDCNNKIHFSQKFFKEFSNEINDQLIPIIKNLNENIYKEFLISIQMINISSELQFLHSLANIVGLTDIKHRINLIQNDFNQINKRFTQIIQQNSQVSNHFLTETLNEFELFLEKVMESTIDSCPLPMNNILKIDRFICHETATLINGLWLRILFFMFALLFGLWIFGLYLYKRFN